MGVSLNQDHLVIVAPGRCSTLRRSDLAAVAGAHVVTAWLAYVQQASASCCTRNINQRIADAGTIFVRDSRSRPGNRRFFVCREIPCLHRAGLLRLTTFHASATHTNFTESRPKQPFPLRQHSTLESFRRSWDSGLDRFRTRQSKRPHEASLLKPLYLTFFVTLYLLSFPIIQAGPCCILESLRLHVHSFTHSTTFLYPSGNHTHYCIAQ